MVSVLPKLENDQRTIDQIRYVKSVHHTDLTGVPGDLVKGLEEFIHLYESTSY